MDLLFRSLSLDEAISHGTGRASDRPPGCPASGRVLITTGMALRVSAPQCLVGSAMTRGVSETTLCLSDLCWIQRGYCRV